MGFLFLHHSDGGGGFLPLRRQVDDRRLRTGEVRTRFSLGSVGFMHDRLEPCPGITAYLQPQMSHS
jgi:hypothetical protein